MENTIKAPKNILLIHNKIIICPKVESLVQSYINIYDGDFCPYAMDRIDCIHEQNRKILCNRPSTRVQC